MESEPKAREPRDPIKTVTSVVVVLVLLAIGIIGYVVYDNLQRSDADSAVVEDGDKVTLNYVGRFEDGRVFDTSLYSIASDDALNPKSFTFTLREEGDYEPFDMTAGLYGESGGTIKGFALGVIGMHLNEKKYIIVPPEDGYAVDPSMVETADLLEDVPVVVTITETDFRSLFGITAEPMLMVPHYKWDWDVIVTEVSLGLVTYKNTPVVGELVTPFGDPDDPDEPMGWKCRVESVDLYYNDGEGRITVQHLLTEADTYWRQGIDHLGTTFVLSSVDEEAGTFQMHTVDTVTGYNGEICGRTLIFEVTVREIA